MTERQKKEEGLLLAKSLATISIIWKAWWAGWEEKRPAWERAGLQPWEERAGADGGQQQTMLGLRDASTTTSRTPAPNSEGPCWEWGARVLRGKLRRRGGRRGWGPNREPPSHWGRAVVKAVCALGQPRSGFRSYPLSHPGHVTSETLNLVQH